MSTWRWRYSPEKCDHGICVGDCDICDREDEEEEIREEGEPIPHWRGQDGYNLPFQCEEDI